MNYEPKLGERLQSMGFVTDAALDRIGRTAIIDAARRKAVEELLHTVAEKYVKFERYMGFCGQTYRIDVRILEASDYEKLVREAYFKGVEDAQKFNHLPVWVEA